MGCHSLPIRCYNTAPTATSEASVMMHVGAKGFGCERCVAVARTCENEVMAVSFQMSLRSVPGGVERRSLRGPRMEAQLGMKWW